VNDFLGGTGLFPPNPSVDQGTFGSLWSRLTGTGSIHWNLAGDVIAGEGRSTGRLYGELRHSMGGRRGVTLGVKAGVATQPTMQQSLFRLGGLATVRGFDYGERRGSAFWSVQLDVAPVKGRIRPVVFLDAGQAASAADLFSSRALVGGGLGLSLFNGVLRFDLSHPISPDTHRKVRFDLLLRAPR
jgi:outer membrane translocation and assembly module TamA